jgi:hypothetical protein
VNASGVEGNLDTDEAVLFPANIPIWGDIQKVSEYHAVLG